MIIRTSIRWITIYLYIILYDNNIIRTYYTYYYYITMVCAVHGLDDNRYYTVQYYNIIYTIPIYTLY